MRVLDLEVESRKGARSEKCPRPVYYRNTVCGRVQPARLLAGWMHPAIEIFTLYFKRYLHVGIYNKARTTPNGGLDIVTYRPCFGMSTL